MPKAKVFMRRAKDVKCLLSSHTCTCDSYDSLGHLTTCVQKLSQQMPSFREMSTFMKSIVQCMDSQDFSQSSGPPILPRMQFPENEMDSDMDGNRSEEDSRTTDGQGDALVQDFPVQKD